MKVQMEYKYKVYLNRFGSDVVHLVSVHVEDSAQGYNCWGWEIAKEAQEGSGVTFKPRWLTAGDALNAAVEELTVKL